MGTESITAITNDRELRLAIEALDRLLDLPGAEDEPEVDRLGDLIHGYEQRTNVLDRPSDGTDEPARY